MKRPDDEMLMTFADNALPPDEMAAIERYLATDADARALVAAFRRSREAVRAAIPIEAFERSDDPLANAILSGELGGRMATNAERLDHRSPIEATAGEDTRADVLRLPRHRPAPANESRSPILVSRQWALPLAASIALVIGGFVGYGLRGTSNLDKIADGSKVAPEIGIGTLPGSSPIARFLERATTGETLALTNRDGSTGREARSPDELILAGTFNARDGRHCREFERIEGHADRGPVAAGVACRSTAGDWTIEGVIHIAAAPVDHGGNVEPASGTADGVPEVSALEALIKMLGASAVLTPDEERKLIDRGWRRTP